jgi:nucleoredoxin
MNTFLRRTSCVVIALAALATAGAAPEKLELRDLANRPDRWPAQVTVGKDMQFGGGAKLTKGQKVTVVEFTGGNEVGVDAGNGQLFGIDAAECDLLEAANAAWAKLTPEQRALEPRTVIEDASLWPAKVKCTAGFRLDSGKDLPPGAEYDLVNIDRSGQVTLYTADGDAKLMAQLAQTDAVARARELAGVDKSKRPARIAAALKGRLVDATGKPVKDDDLDGQQLFALYYGASWCGPCRAFSPGFVKYINTVAAANPKLTVVLCSNDEKDADMLKYMSEEKMPWAAVPMKSMKQSPVLWTYLRGSIPQLTIVDRHGKVIADSWSGNAYVGPKQALAGLDRALKSGAAK